MINRLNHLFGKSLNRFEFSNSYWEFLFEKNNDNYIKYDLIETKFFVSIIKKFFIEQYKSFE